MTTHTPTPAIGQYIKIKDSNACWLINREDAQGNLYAQIPGDVYEVAVTGQNAHAIESVTSMHHDVPSLIEHAARCKLAAIAKAEGK